METRITLKSGQIKAISYLGVLAIFALAVSMSWSFLYNNFYLVMTQSAEIMNMQKSVPLETLDLNKFEEVIKKIEGKSITKEGIITNLNDPFR